MQEIGQIDLANEYVASYRIILDIFDEMVYGYPTRFFDLKCRTWKEFDFLRHNWNDWGMLIECCFYNLRLKNEAATPVPYIPISKCKPLHFDNEDDSPQVDNGRLLHTGANGYCGMIITEIDYNMPVCLVIGNEGNGVSKNVIEACNSKLYIPMHNNAESLNAAVAASIIMWEMIK